MNLQLTDYEKNSLNKLGESIQNGQWSNEALVNIYDARALIEIEAKS